MAEPVSKSKPFVWHEKRVRAAILLAEDEQSDAEIAESVGVSRVALWKWKQDPAFTERIAEHVAALERAVSRYRISKRRARIKVLDDLHSGLLRVIAERAEDDDEEVAGGGSGLMVRQVRLVGAGENAVTVIEYQVDTAISHEIRALHKQAAQELGQWSEKSEVAVSGGIRREYVVITDHDATPLDPETIDGLGDLDGADTTAETD